MRLRRFCRALLGLALLAAGTGGGAAMDASFPGPGEWPCHRGNGQQDAHAPGKGNIATPRIAWRHFIGAVDTLLVAEPAPGAGTLLIPPSAAGAEGAGLPGATSDPRWGLLYPTAEIGGRVQSVVPTSTTTYAHVLPDVPGLQKLEFESGFAKPTVKGEWDRCVGRCFAWRDGAWQKVWETDPIDLLFHAMPLVGDFDADGTPEVAVLPFYDLLLFDARTGRLKERCRFTDGRSYGFFGAYDLDGDGKSEFVVQADFAKHVDVLGFRGGKLALLWRREIETDITNPQKVLRVTPHPVGDVDGDGKQEVLVNAFNDAGDHRWHLSVHDGLTGAVKADLPDECLQGLADVNGDGIAEILTIRAEGGGLPAYGEIRVRSLKGGRAVTLWRDPLAAWHTWSPTLPPNVQSIATQGDVDVLSRRVDDRWTVVVRRPVKGKPGEVSVTTARWSAGTFHEGMRLSGPGLEALALDAEGCLLARCTTRPGSGARVAVASGKTRALGSQPRGVPAGTAVVAREAGRTTILVQGAMGREEIVALDPPSGGRPAVERWRLPGRGQTTNWPTEALGPVVAGLFGDGHRQVLYATASPGGCGRLVAADLDGREVWHHDYAAIPGTPPVWNTGGILLWQVGHFTDARRQDVLVTLRRSMMHSEETGLLCGADGRELWHRDRQISSRGVGGTPFAIADLDGDGLDDAASFHPSILYILDGATGNDILARGATWPGVPASPVYWGLPVAGDFEAKGRPALLFATTRRSMTGLVRADGSLAWSDALDRSTTCLPALGDFDGSGRRQVVGLGYDDGIRCYDAASGKVLWRLASPVRSAHFASADINADGRDEVLFTSGSALTCLGTEGAGTPGKLLWKLDLPSTVGPPTLADVDGSGNLSILLVGADGYVTCVGG